MPKYQIEVHEIYRHIVTVRAENRDEALVRVNQRIKDRAWLWALQASHKFRAWRYRIGDHMVFDQTGVIKMECYEYPLCTLPHISLRTDL